MTSNEERLREVLRPFAGFADRLDADAGWPLPDAAPIGYAPHMSPGSRPNIGDCRNARAALALPAQAAGEVEIIERCAKLADAWLGCFADKTPQYVSAQKWACDAVSDIAVGIRALKATAAPPPSLSGAVGEGWQKRIAEIAMRHISSGYGEATDELMRASLTEDIEQLIADALSAPQPPNEEWISRDKHIAATEAIRAEYLGHVLGMRDEIARLKAAPQPPRVTEDDR